MQIPGCAELDPRHPDATVVATCSSRLLPHVHRGSTIVSATKGLEQDTLLRVSEIIEQELGDVVSVAVLSGPSFASEVASGSSVPSR